MPKRGSKRSRPMGSTQVDPETEDHVRSNLGIAERVKWLRLYREKTQTAFARELGVSQASVAGWESGKDTHPLGIVSATAIRDAYGVSLDWLYLGIADALPPTMEKEWNKYVKG